MSEPAEVGREANAGFLGNTMKCVNVACGGTFVPGWLNLDFVPVSPDVRRANLLYGLPVPDASVDVLYSSHFIEHIPRSSLPAFLNDCARVLRPGGQLRLVTPDLQVLCSEYLKHRESGAHDKADFVILEILDQCVRTRRGGALGRYYERVAAGLVSAPMPEFVAEMTGHAFGEAEVPARGLIARAASAMSRPGPLVARLYARALVALLPKAFREQNVSLADVGERHQWLYDFRTLEAELRAAGLEDVRKMASDESAVAGFPLHPLDLNADGTPRKGRESMYVEARRPLR